MRRSMWLLLSLLAGCAGDPGDGPQACSVQQAAVIPVGITQHRLLLPATIDESPVTVQVDTGSERTVITPSAVESFGLKTVARAQSHIIGTGGTITAKVVSVPSFGIGGMEMLDRHYALAPAAISGDGAVDAILGADWLNDFDVDLDIPESRMTLYQVDGCGADHVAWSGPHVAVPAEIYGRGLVLLSARLDGAPVTALLDSGATASALSDAAASRMGMTDALLAADRPGHGAGIDGHDLAVRLHRFGQFDLGGTVTRDMPVAVGGVVSPMAEMLLGLDWLDRHRVWIDYRDHMIFLPAPQKVS